ncbi:YcaO-like family protein [Arcanobacterium haemolyticum]|uniref:YcaO-like family protein n=1 Tax=Arcanobacterium haemolyticum TaxID=28264 RepID=UPI0021CA96A0|nr:YcaO-like family protein [Arcanobacterium haemolyticum]
MRGSTLLSLFEELTVERGKKGDLLLLDSQAGFVVCAMSEPETDGEAELGFGASHSLRIASERAITELQQIRSSITHGSTWADNGASTSGELDEYPNMKKLASRHFQLPKRGGETVEVPLNVEFTGSPVIQLRENGYVPLGRMIWSDTIDIGSIIVAQAVVPGLETLNNLIFNRPILPLGRLRSASSIDFLLKRK